MAEQSLNLDDRRFDNAFVVEHGRIDAKDLENLRDASRNKNGLPVLAVGELTSTRRWRTSAMEIAEVRLHAALCGPKVSGGLRQFMSPTIAAMTVQVVKPLHRFLEVDKDGSLKAPSAVADQWFISVKAVGSDPHSTVDVLNGREVVDDLNTIDNQVMIVPITRLVYEVVDACRKRVKWENEIADELAAGAIDALKKAGRLEED